MFQTIDFKTPTHRINEILFDVKLQDVGSNFKFNGKEEKLIIIAKNYKAVVNQQNGAILSIVGKNYRLIPNVDAIKMGKDLFATLYPGISASDLIPFKVIAPLSMASVHVDFIHKDVNFNVFEQDTWLPFLRVSNSYNRTHALSFEIGFVRKLCSNGVLFNKKSMKLKYIHNSNKMDRVLNDATQIEATTKYFMEKCTQLREYEIPNELVFPLVCQILKLNLTAGNNKQRYLKLKYLSNLSNIIRSLTTRYGQNNKINAYTVLNVVTDLTSHQDEYKNIIGYYFNVRSFYTRPMDWAENFSTIITRNDFSIKKYLESTIKNLNKFESDTVFKWLLN